jgi:hypothetical protein
VGGGDGLGGGGFWGVFGGTGVAVWEIGVWAFGVFESFLSEGRLILSFGKKIFGSYAAPSSTFVARCGLIDRNFVLVYLVS